MKKSMLAALCLSLLAFAPACMKKKNGQKAPKAKTAQTKAPKAKKAKAPKAKKAKAPKAKKAKAPKAMKNGKAAVNNNMNGMQDRPMQGATKAGY